jgi:hypothetical protein
VQDRRVALEIAARAVVHLLAATAADLVRFHHAEAGVLAGAAVTAVQAVLVAGIAAEAVEVTALRGAWKCAQQDATVIVPTVVQVHARLYAKKPVKLYARYHVEVTALEPAQIRVLTHVLARALKNAAIRAQESALEHVLDRARLSVQMHVVADALADAQDLAPGPVLADVMQRAKKHVAHAVVHARLDVVVVQPRHAKKTADPTAHPGAEQDALVRAQQATVQRNAPTHAVLDA